MSAILEPCPFCGGPAELVGPELVECRCCREHRSRNSHQYNYDYWQSRAGNQALVNGGRETPPPNETGVGA